MRPLVQLIVQAGAVVRCGLLTLGRSIRTQARRCPGPASRIGRHQSVLLAVLLMLVVLGVHYLPLLLAVHYEHPAKAERALFYVAQAAKGIAMMILLLALMPRRRRMVPVWAAGAWLIYEDALVVGCRLAVGIENVPAAAPNPWQGICQQLTDAPLYIGAAVLAVIAAACIWHTLEDDATDADD